MLGLMVAFTQCDGKNGGGGNGNDIDTTGTGTGPGVDTRIKDGDGNVYTEVKIGEQTWLKENLKTTKYNDGTPIANPTADIAWEESMSGAYCWYENKESNKNTYGALYNFPAAESGKICPKGWHVPFDTEWLMLLSKCEGEANAGGQLKEAGTAHWTVGDGATDEKGFTALPNGERKPVGTFESMRSKATFWTSSPASYSPVDGVYYYMSAEVNSALKEEVNRRSGFAIRCIKD